MRDGRQRTLTRRTLLRRSAVTGLAALGGPAFLAACTSAPSAPQPAVASPAVSPATQVAASARPGGRITWAVYAEPSGLDPQVNPQGTSLQFHHRVYDQ